MPRDISVKELCFFVGGCSVVEFFFFFNFYSRNVIFVDSIFLYSTKSLVLYSVAYSILKVQICKNNEFRFYDLCEPLAFKSSLFFFIMRRNSIAQLKIFHLKEDVLKMHELRKYHNFSVSLLNIRMLKH